MNGHNSYVILKLNNNLSGQSRIIARILLSSVVSQLTLHGFACFLLHREHTIFYPGILLSFLFLVSFPMQFRLALNMSDSSF